VHKELEENRGNAAATAACGWASTVVTSLAQWNRSGTV